MKMSNPKLAYPRVPIQTRIAHVLFMFIFLIHRPHTALAKHPPPNILLLITDDQDAILGGTDHMPFLKRLIADEGITFQNGFVHTPICCPSRSSILTGKYLHNGGALNNSLSGNCNGLAWQERNEKRSIGVIAQGAGYRTAYAGKYLNTYGFKTKWCDGPCNRVPPGWDRWTGLVGNSKYYNYSLISSDDGGATSERKKHGNDYADDYLPDIVANRTLEYLKDFVTSADQKPFLVTASWPSAHMPFTEAPQFECEFPDANVTRTPNWNASHALNLEKHWIMRRLAPIDSKTLEWIEHTYRKRLRTLLSVDQHISQFVDFLEDNGVLDNTYIIYTSDNGWQYGQHRISFDKRQLYEHDIRVPFYMRGPGVKKEYAIEEAVLNIDIAPTIQDIVTSWQEQTFLDDMDGQSFLPLVVDKSSHSPNDDGSHWRNDFLITYHGEGNPKCGMSKCPPPLPKDYHQGDAYNNTYNCLRSMDPNFIYCEFQDDE
eukprot:CAMPEP_0172491690 /NCGR_PEP_ID=MMETSP1066-20121228/22553_1 /TAXON_ID=671091 /ORGANISM="Coscinodiscus wailesii, Strain CCMP2513" /LENGTH=485 /DNA_ID=CAMNT_0013260855 /DNA_START=55 /DNA_END=1509 /DNA_ORIENTATION=-